MKSSFLVNVLALAMVVSIGGMGCRHGTKGLTPIPGQKTAIANPSSNQQQIPPGSGLNDSEKGVTDRALTDGTGLPSDRELFEGRPVDREALKSYTIHFDYDRATVKKEDAPKLDEVAKYLKANADKDLVVEGYCDERGTEEYNRALGERRALAAREHLVGLGVAANRMITRSFGEDKPAVEGHDEAAWSLNRRAEFIVLLPKK